MQILSNVPLQNVRVGDRVKSMMTGNEGFISRIIDIEDARRKDDYEYLIKWDNGNISLHWKYNYSSVWLM